MSLCAARRRSRDLSLILDGFTDILVNILYLKILDLKEHATIQHNPD